jgi:hypothetical protein
VHERMFATGGSVGRVVALWGKLVDSVRRMLIDGSHGMLLLSGGHRG